MEKISELTVCPLTASKYVQPLSLKYIQNGVQKTWDIVKVHKSVSIVIYNISRQVLVLVRQFRPAVYFNSVPEADRVKPIDIEKYPSSLGMTLELCAGIVDKDISLEEIARCEILEECGYDVPVKNLEKIITFRSGVGISGDQQTLFYAEVTDSMKVSEGGGNASENEMVQVIDLSLDEAWDYIHGESVLSPGGFLYGLTWFFNSKSAYKKK